MLRAAEQTQLWLVTHSTRLADAIAVSGAAKVRTVAKRDGATCIEGLKAWGVFEDEEDDASSSL